MSAEIVAKAIQEAESDVSMITGLVAAFTYIDDDGDQCRGYYSLDGQSSITTNGLADLVMFYARQRFSHDGDH